jgi:hypothetical protein
MNTKSNILCSIRYNYLMTVIIDLTKSVDASYDRVVFSNDVLDMFHPPLVLRCWPATSWGMFVS